MKKVGVFIDVSNLYFCIDNKFKGRKVNYQVYLDYCRDLGDILQAIVYGAELNDEAIEFKFKLKEMGFITKFKEPKIYRNRTGETKRKADWDVGIAMDIVDRIDQLDIIVLGTADGDLTPLVEWCIRKSKIVIIIASGISRELRECATKAVEIPESFLIEGVKNAMPS